MPDDTTPAAVDEFGLPTDPAALHSAAVLLQERLRVLQAAEADRLAATATIERPPDPLVQVEWLRTPRKGDCHHNGRSYFGRGPLVHRSTNTVVRAGERAQLPADVARVFHEAGFVRVLEDPDQVIAWTPTDGIPLGVVPGPNPNDARAWEQLAQH